MRTIIRIVLAAALTGVAPGQSTDSAPRFGVADVHTSPSSANAFFRTSFHNGRYEVRNASMLDLIAAAYSSDPLKVVGGPSWLEFDKFDITALAPANTPQDTLKLMLRPLLAERFGLAVHNDTQPLDGFVLSAGKGKLKLKEADPSGKTGCENLPVTPPPPSPGQIRVPMQGIACHNMTMEAFATELAKGPAGGGYITNKVVDSTGLKGSWDFEYRFTYKTLLQIAGPGSDAVTLADAMDKQLGLKLDEQKLPTAVTVVDKVNEKPTDNPPDVAQKLPAPPPAEFEVADIKPSQTPDFSNSQALQAALNGAGVQRGGRVNLPGFLFPLKQLIIMAWNLNSAEDIPGAPKWLDIAQFDIVAKLPDGFVSPNSTPPIQDVAPMLQALLIDRFKMKSHFENQQVTAYALVAAKPKMKKADPSVRTKCTSANGPRPEPTGGIILPSRILTCQNMSMAQLASQLQGLAGQYVHYPVIDATGLGGGWDFSLTYSPIPAAQLAGLRGAPAANPFGGAGAADPVGGTSLFDAIEKQLGVKLEAQKRTYPVFVIDHIEEKPTEN